ncbi:MAG: hypothetical protein J0H74_33135 [Chitinophagaceae bacterium]|nr:hypothetical protein [Chitinophagaceae bacterium]
MTFWNDILHTALLGTDKTDISPAGLGPDLALLAEQIGSQTSDKEERFLRIAALAFNYRQAGATALERPDVQPDTAPPEQRPYCSPVAMQALSEILAQEQSKLLELWLNCCRDKGQLARPDLLPALLETGADKKRFHKDVLACGGERARWLARLNPDWSVYSTPETSDEDIWQTGGPEERGSVLAKLCHTDPDKAREWLMTAWSKEDANTRAALLSTYSSTTADLPFLESLLTDKSKKVREVAFLKLQVIPASNLIQQYKEALKARLILKKEKGLLGLTSKFVLSIQPPPDGEEFPPLLVQSGIEKLSNKKEMTDEEYICFQLISYISPDFYTPLWQKSKEEIITLFTEDPLGKKLLPALITAIARHRDHESTRLLLSRNIIHSALLDLLPEEDQDLQAEKLFGSAPEEAMVYAQGKQKEWGPLLTEQALRFAAKDNYRYSKGWVNMYIDRIPTGAISLLPKIQPFPDLSGSSAGWPSISEHLQKLLELKIQIITAFK